MIPREILKKIRQIELRTNRLVTETQRTISGQTVTVKEVRSLGPGGADMTVETTVIVQHGYSMSGAKNYSNSKDVFTKTRP